MKTHNFVGGIPEIIIIIYLSMVYQYSCKQSQYYYLNYDQSL